MCLLYKSKLFSSLYTRHCYKFYIYVISLEFSELLYRTIPHPKVSHTSGIFIPIVVIMY